MSPKGGRPKFRVVSLSRHNFHSFFPLLGGLLVELWTRFKAEFHMKCGRHHAWSGGGELCGLGPFSSKLVEFSRYTCAHSSQDASQNRFIHHHFVKTPAGCRPPGVTSVDPRESQTHNLVVHGRDAWPQFHRMAPALPPQFSNPSLGASHFRGPYSGWCPPPFWSPPFLGTHVHPHPKKP